MNNAKTWKHSIHATEQKGGIDDGFIIEMIITQGTALW